VNGALVGAAPPNQLAPPDRARRAVEDSLNLERRPPPVLNGIDSHRQQLSPGSKTLGDLRQVLLVVVIVIVPHTVLPEYNCCRVLPNSTPATNAY